MRIFVTGATGFIGSHLMERLAQTDHEVLCLVRASSDVRQLQKCGVTLVRGDVTDRDSLVAGMEGCDWVANLANVYSFWEPRKALYREVNVVGTRNVMEAALKTGVTKVAHVSSVVTYGRPQHLPFTEETPEGPEQFSEYARTKLEGDRIVWKMVENEHLPALMLYPGAVVGAGDTKASGQFLIDLITRNLPMTVFDDSIISWVHVRDCAEAIVAALEKPGNIGERYLVVGERLPNRAFTRLVSEISGVRAPRMNMPDALVMPNALLLTGLARLIRKTPKWGMATDQMRTLREGIEADGSKAERELGLSYSPIRSALEEAIDWYRQNSLS